MTSFLSVYASQISSLLAFPNHCCAVLGCLCLLLDLVAKALHLEGVADNFDSSRSGSPNWFDVSTATQLHIDTRGHGTTRHAWTAWFPLFLTAEHLGLFTPFHASRAIHHRAPVKTPRGVPLRPLFDLQSSAFSTQFICSKHQIFTINRTDRSIPPGRVA
jgi:hypothetical protein